MPGEPNQCPWRFTKRQIWTGVELVSRSNTTEKPCRAASAPWRVRKDLRELQTGRFGMPEAGLFGSSRPLRGAGRPGLRAHTGHIAVARATSGVYADGRPARSPPLL